MASRYDNLNEAISSTINDSPKNKPYRIVEIGVHHGDRAVSMIKYARKLGRSNIEYYGFDLFEDITPSVNAGEFGKPVLALSREEIRKKLLATGASKVQLIKGDTKLTLPQAIKNIPVANVVFVDGGHSVETVASDVQNILNCCNERTRVLVDDCYPSVYDKGCAFLAKCFGLFKEYGITVEEMRPTDTFKDNPYGDGPLSIQFMSIKCAAQLTPTRLEGLAKRMLNEVFPSSQEPQEFFPDKSFVEDNPDAPQLSSHKGASSSPSKEAGEAAGDPFLPANSTSGADVQPVRVCKNSGGELPSDHCKKPSDTCGRWEPSVECRGLGEVSEGQADPVPVPCERPESDPIVEQGDRDSAVPQGPDNSGGELGSEVSPPVGKRRRKGSSRRRKRGGADDERSGPQG